MIVDLLVNLKRKRDNRIIRAARFDDRKMEIPPEVLREVELGRRTVNVIKDDRPKTMETTTSDEDVAKTEVETSNTESTTTSSTKKSGRRKK